MNQRTAMLMAGGLVLAMVVAGMALAMGVTSPSQAAAHVAKTGQERNPIVRTVTRTETVHRQAQTSGSSDGYVGTAGVPATAPAYPSSSSWSGDDGAEVEHEAGPVGQEHEDD